MKPLFATILGSSENKVFETRLIRRASFTTEFHFHTECQMNYIERGSGYRIIGDCVENFAPGELTFLGSDIPHVWYNERDEVAGLPDKKMEPNAHSVALFFRPEQLRDALSRFYDTKELEKLFDIARRGMKFYGQAKHVLKDLLLQLSAEDDGLERLSILLRLLKTMGAATEYVLLTGPDYTNTYQLRDNERMEKVFKYLFANYSEELELENIAAVACMSKQAFCRYFKSRTQKTLTQFITEIRIAHAKKMLIEAEDINVSKVAYDCGYKNVSNFNRFFKSLTGVTPSQFQKKVHKK